MFRPLPLIGTIGMVALTINIVNAQQTSDCQNCDNSNSVGNSSAGETGNWQYVIADNGYCDHSSACLCSTAGFPDKDWNPPARLPVNRDGIWYRNYWPQAWYGNAGGNFIANSPMVYRPTDTSQLGYSYAKVPTWRAKNMIPPTPCPSHFHARVCVPRAQSCRHIHGCPAGNPCNGTACQSCPQGMATYAVPGRELQQATMALTPLPVTAASPLQATPTTDSLPVVRAPMVAHGFTNAAGTRIRPVSSVRKNGLFRLTRLKYLFD